MEKGRKAMRNKPRKIHVDARLWFDTVNGNTYHSARVTVDDDKVLFVPFQYGYGEQYLQSALEVLDEHGIVEQVYYENGFEKPLWQIANDEGFTLTTQAQYATKREVKAWGEERQ